MAQMAMPCRCMYELENCTYNILVALAFAVAAVVWPILVVTSLGLNVNVL